jgi:ribulose bisphosphate carboxylase small subunit
MTEKPLTPDEKAVLWCIQRFLVDHLRGQIIINLDGARIKSIVETVTRRPEEIAA